MGRSTGNLWWLYNLQIIGQGTHTVVYVATENDSVFAFDGNSNTGKECGAAVAGELYKSGEGDYDDSIDRPGDDCDQSADWNHGNAGDRRHQRDFVCSGGDEGERDILSATARARYPHRSGEIRRPGGDFGDGEGHVAANSVKGYISFDPLRSNQRPALLLVNGVVYIAWASHGLETVDPYHGWVMGYNETTLAQVARILRYAEWRPGRDLAGWRWAGCRYAGKHLLYERQRDVRREQRWWAIMGRVTCRLVDGERA